MISEKIQAKHILDLSNLEEILKEGNIQCSLLTSGKNLPLSMLIVPMEKDNKGRPRAYSCSYIPMDDDDLENISLLQIYSQFPIKLNKSKIEDLRTLLLACNILQPIGNFGIKDETDIYLRYVLVVKKFDLLDPEEISETLMMFEYGINMYQDLIEDINSGNQSIKEALESLNDY